MTNEQKPRDSAKATPFFFYLYKDDLVQSRAVTVLESAINSPQLQIQFNNCEFILAHNEAVINVSFFVPRTNLISFRKGIALHMNTIAAINYNHV